MDAIKLYKKDSANKLRYLEVLAEDSKIIQRSGIVGTTKEIEHVKEAKPKNIGKANATTSAEQAILEVESIITSKLKEGYFRTSEEASETTVILPMLAKSYENEKHKIDWESSFVQPKLDGMRCIAHVSANGDVSLISRDGRNIETMDHIIQELSTLGKDVILDGELYLHGKSFQENMKLIKKYRAGETETISYHVYDVVLEESYPKRKAYLDSLIQNFKHIIPVSTYSITTEDMLMEKHSDNISSGYEGSMIRWGHASYKVKSRSSNLLKLKDFQDIDAEIIDIVPAEQRPEWGVPVLQYNGKTFRSGLRYSHEERKDLLLNREQYIGKVANVRFFEYTDEGLPRFPVMVGIHEDR